MVPAARCFGEQMLDRKARGLGTGRRHPDLDAFEIGRNALHDPRDLPRIGAGRGEEPHRFGQQLDQEERDDERQEPADVEHRTPSPERQHLRAEQARDERAERHPRKEAADEDRLQPLRRVLGGERHDIGHRAAQAETGQEAEDDEFLQRRRPGREDGEEREGERRADHDELAADAIGNRPAGTARQSSDRTARR